MAATPLDGILDRIVWSGPSFSGGTHVIGKLADGQSVKGDMHDPRVGENYRLWGQWGQSKFGPQYNFTSYEIVVDRSAGGVEQYLRTYVDGLGPAKAAAIVDHFGVDTLAVLRTDADRAAEVAGITPKIVAAIRKHFDEQAENDPVAESKLIEMFRSVQFRRSLIKQLMRAFRSAAAEVITKDPYRLLEFRGAGWKLVDAFALSVAKYRPDGIERHRAAIVEAFEMLARDDGHTCESMTRVDEVAAKLLGMAARRDAWAALAADRKVVSYVPGPDGVRVVALGKYAFAEAEIAERIVALMDGSPPIGPLDVEGLADEQVAAVRMVEAHPVSILTGAPGTGKTFGVTRIVGGLIRSGAASSGIIFVAPTGAAAKRGAITFAEAGIRGIACSTIHKALAPAPSTEDAGAARPDAKANRERVEFTFGHNAANPIRASVIVIDECSMQDIPLAASLFRAIAPGTRVVIVGDENQLPSVGPGSFLRDVMAAGIPSTTLRQIRRSDSAGTVVRACHAIRDGKMPEPDATADLASGKNWVHIEATDPKEIADKVVALYQGVKTFDRFWGVQVIVSQHDKYPFSGNPLNARLAPILNPIAARALASLDDDGDPAGRDEPKYHVGDKVIRTKNGVAIEMVPVEDMAGSAVEPDDVEDDDFDWVKGESRGRDDRPEVATWTWRGEEYLLEKGAVVNGDVGVVRDILMVPKCGKQVVVEFTNPTRLVRLPFGSAEIQQAYAMTCHKMQGSGADMVIVPFHTSIYFGLLTREWFYTAISRTKQLLVTIGPREAIRMAVSRKTVHLRKTRLVELIRAEMDERAERLAAHEAAQLAGAVEDMEGIEGEVSPLLALEHEEATMGG